MLDETRDLENDVSRRAGKAPKPKRDEGERQETEERPPQPLLMRVKIGYFGVSVGLSAQAQLWHVLSTAPGLEEYSIPIGISQAFWYTSLVFFLLTLGIYVWKAILWPYGVLREVFSPVRVNFFFMPSLTTTFLASSIPPEIYSSKAVVALFYIILCVDSGLRLYVWGEWMVSRSMGLGRFYTPAMVTVVNCFILANLGTSEDVQQEQVATALVAVGLAFYVTVFVRAFGRPINEYIPPALLPSLFFYLAPPFSIASVWIRLPVAAGISSLQDSFGVFFFYFGLFMYVLVLRFLHSFFILPFALTWWAYTFPMAAAGVAAVQWAESIQARIIFALFLSCVSTLLVVSIFGIMVFKIVMDRSFAAILPHDDLMDFLLDFERLEDFRKEKRRLILSARTARTIACKERGEWMTMSIADRYKEHCAWLYDPKTKSCSSSHQIQLLHTCENTDTLNELL